CNVSHVRGALHLIVDVTPVNALVPEHELFQVTDYVKIKSLEEGVRGRCTSLHQGVIGRCARTGRAEVVNFLNSHEYEERMVREFGFSIAEMHYHSKSSRSYLAHPISDDTRVRAVLYFDTTELQVFPHAANEEVIARAARTIRDHLYTA